MQKDHEVTSTFKKAKRVIPDTYIEAVLKARPTAFGYAFVAADNPGEVLVSQGASASAQEVKEVLNTFAENEILFAFSNSPKKLEPASTPPYQLLKDEKGRCLIAGVPIGALDNYHAEGDFSDAYHCAFKHLAPKLAQIYRLTKGDMKAVVEELRSQVTTDELSSLGSGKTALSIICSTGDIITFPSAGFEYAQFEWGGTSDSHGYGEDKPTGDASKTNIDKVKELLAKRKAEKEKAEGGGKPETPPGDKQPTEQPGSGTKVEELPPLPAGVTVENGDYYYQCPTAVSGNKAIRESYELIAGFKPIGQGNSYKDKPKVKIDLSKNPRWLASRMAAASKTTGGVDPDKERTKNTDIKYTNEKVDPGSSGFLTITNDQVKKFQDGFLKRKTILDATNQPIPDPKMLKEREKKWPTFTEKMGIRGGLKETINWSADDLLWLGKSDPEMLVALYLETRLDLVKNVMASPAASWLNTADRKVM